MPFLDREQVAVVAGKTLACERVIPSPTNLNAVGASIVPKFLSARRVARMHFIGARIAPIDVLIARRLASKLVNSHDLTVVNAVGVSARIVVVGIVVGVGVHVGSFQAVGFMSFLRLHYTHHHHNTQE